MPIKQDRSDLPAGDDRIGFPPVQTPLVVHLLAQDWYDDFVAGDDHIPTARWWASMAAMCSRSVAYQIQEAEAKRGLKTLTENPEYQGLPHDGQDHTRELDITVAAARVVSLAPTNPPGIADAWRMGLGSMVHRELQERLPKVFPGAEVEVRVTIDEIDGSARADAVIRQKLDITGPDDKPEYVILLELKTMNGFGFKLAATNFKGPAEGPKVNAVTQGAIAAREIDADLLIIGVLSLECISPDVARNNKLSEIGRFGVEWHFTKDEYLPYAEREIKRVARILQVMDEGKLPPRHHPELGPRARITDPSTGGWVIKNDQDEITHAGKFWGCGYCWNRDRCIADGPS